MPYNDKVSAKTSPPPFVYELITIKITILYCNVPDSSFINLIYRTQLNNFSEFIGDYGKLINSEL